MKDKIKILVLMVVCLLCALPATVAQSQSPFIQARTLCRDGNVTGVMIKVVRPGTYSIVLNPEACSGRSEASTPTIIKRSKEILL